MQGHKNEKFYNMGGITSMKACDTPHYTISFSSDTAPHRAQSPIQ